MAPGFIPGSRRVPGQLSAVGTVEIPAEVQSFLWDSLVERTRSVFRRLFLRAQKTKLLVDTTRAMGHNATKFLVSGVVQGAVIMPKKERNRLTPLEALIMDTVWDMSQATVRQVKERLEPVKPMAYNTVLTMMRILRDKGFLEAERNGRSDVYRPMVTRQQAAGRSLRELLDRFFAGSATAMVSQLLDSDEVSSEEVKAIRREVDRRLRSEPS